ENEAAERIFEALPPSHRNEYLRWIGEAKRTETRRRQATKAAEMMVDKHGEARPSLP
ncbi:MAG: YdeI/OmpD-associated family protein, partial [Actinomyces oris]